MLGYLDDPDATKAAIDADGWLHTGNASSLDAAGNLTITGRLKDMYICGGFNVYPAEVEQVLAGLDGVAESAVYRHARPAARRGRPGLPWSPRPGYVLAEADVLAFCRERLANYKVPRRVEFRDALPRNPSGKVLKTTASERNPDGEQGPLRPAWPHGPDHPEPAASTSNAQNSAMTYALDVAFARAVNDNQVAVLVLAGAGDRFYAGHDIGTPERDLDKSFDRQAVLWWDHVGKPGADGRYAREMEVYLGMCRRWREIPKPAIAMVHGACHRRRPDARLGLRPDRGGRGRVLRRPGGADGDTRAWSTSRTRGCSGRASPRRFCSPAAGSPLNAPTRSAW